MARKTHSAKHYQSCLRLLLPLLAVSLWLGDARADTLYGTCRRRDGLKVDGTVTISTSWNGKKAYPKQGQYRLDFGGKVGKIVTVYVNGSKYATVDVNDDTRLDIRVR
ncbi:MAG TPA: hypothetical protein VMV10_06025 [Pirellulales bacterium]|nr:hypothetical protein [Pirellulales bacterium]